jgi:hypothetical protein
VCHNFYTIYYLTFVLSYELKSKEEKKLKMHENIRIYPFHKLQIISCEFERSLFESKVSWGTTEDKAEIYMNYMAIIIN